MKTLKQQINHYVFPLIASQLLQMAIGIAALHFATAGSTHSLSAITIIQNFLYAFGGILGAFSLSFNILAARSFYQEKQQFQQYVHSALRLCLLFGGGFLALCLLFGKLFLRYFYGFQGDLLLKASQYLYIMSGYILLLLLSFLFSNLLKFAQKTTVIFRIGVISALLECGLNIILVPLWEIQGAALANMAGVLYLVLAYLWHIFPILKQSLLQSANQMLAITRLGIPLAIQEIFESVLFILVFESFMGHLGNTTLGAYAVISQMFAIIKLPSLMYANSLPVFLPEVTQKQKAQLLKWLLRINFLLFIGLSIVGTLTISAFAQLFTQQMFSHLTFMAGFTFSVMLAVPFYEIIKVYLQAQNHEKMVVMQTIIVNLAGLLVMFVCQLIHIQTYYSLFVVFGLTQVVLALRFSQVSFQQNLK
ncbi:hypothetical protein CIRMBP1252_02452 [Enterococcus cecorum]|nr:hypothetical protein CIRMBP1252_02452 [Enterococcus cecorum]